MTDRDHVEDALRRVVQANLRYYEAVERLSVDYVRAVAGAVGSLGAWLPKEMAVRTADKTRTRRDSHLATVESPASAPALVLEAEDGGSATGAFVVENLLAEGMSSPVVVSAFVSDNGHELRPGLVFDPEIVVLGDSGPRSCNRGRGIRAGRGIPSRGNSARARGARPDDGRTASRAEQSRRGTGLQTTAPLDVGAGSAG
jgi:hypothetical protein